MRAAEILRKLADVIDQNSGQDRPTNSVPHAELAPVEVDNTDNTETSVQIPPLQAKIELMKKSMGMDNAYDGEEECGCGGDVVDDEVAQMKRHAGIPVIAVTELSDDEPFEG